MIEKIPYRSGRLINGEIIENKNHVKLQKSKTGRWHLSTPRTSDGSVARLIGKNDSFKIDNTGNVVRVNQKGQYWNPSLSLWARFYPTDRHKPNAQPGDTVKPLAHGLLNPEWCEWLMGFPKGWTIN
jgi:hypothetical protein